MVIMLRFNPIFKVNTENGQIIMDLLNALKSWMLFNILPTFSQKKRVFVAIYKESRINSSTF